MADFYWIGADGSWSDYTNHWSTTSGGTPNTANAPGTADTAFIDANSSTVSPNFKITMDTNADVTNLIYAPAGALTFDGAGNMIVSGSLAFLTSGGGTIGNLEFYTGDFQFNGPSCYLDATGFNTDGTPDINLNGGVTLQSNLTFAGNIQGATAGTLSFLDPHIISCNQVGAGAQFIGAGTISCSQYTGSSSEALISCSGNVVTAANLADVTMTGNGTLSVPQASNFNFTAGSLTVGTITAFGTATLGGTLTNFNESCTFTKLSGTPGITIKFKPSKNYTATVFDISGVAGTNTTIRSQTNGSAYTLTYSPATGTVNFDYLNVKDCTGYTTVGNEVYWVDGANGFDFGGNTNWQFLSTQYLFTPTPKNFTIEIVKPKMNSIENTKPKFEAVINVKPKFEGKIN